MCFNEMKQCEIHTFDRFLLRFNEQYQNIVGLESTSMDIDKSIDED